MYRIVREENMLTSKVKYFIERQKGWFIKSWTRDLGVPGISGPLGGTTLDGAKYKLEIIKEGNHIVKDIMEIHR
jgi:hypothetical protein